MAAREGTVLWRSFVKLSISRLERVPTKPIYACLSTSSRSPEVTSTSVGNAGAKKAEKVSMAMKAYLQRAKEHQDFVQQEIAEYEIGKRHLANIMSADPDSFTQEDIDNAIQYLLPSGLYDKKSRPLMKHPKDVIPVKKAAQFGMDGRPFHPMFYTGYPNFYDLLHNFAYKYEELKVIAHEMQKKDMTPLQKLDLGGSQWIDKQVLEKKLEETLSDIHYSQFISLMERVAEHPWSHRYKKEILTYRKTLPSQSKLENVPEAQISESGRLYQVATGGRKTAQAKVTVWDKGSGDVSINGKDLFTYFPCMLDREQVMFPLQFTNKLEEVDFEATLESGGSSSQAGALRLALAKALQSLVDKEMMEKMRLAGLLTRDPRVRERKKFGQEGARRKFTWKKR